MKGTLEPAITLSAQLPISFCIPFIPCVPMITISAFRSPATSDMVVKILPVFTIVVIVTLDFFCVCSSTKFCRGRLVDAYK